MRWITFGLFLGAVLGCGAVSEVERSTEAQDLVGEWRAVLASPGGDLPFGLLIEDVDGALRAVIVNGPEEVPTSSVSLRGDQVSIEMSWYDSTLEGRVSEDRSQIAGTWRKTVPGGISELDWKAVRGPARRFGVLAESGLEGGQPEALADLTGRWRVVFADEDGSEEAVAEFGQVGEILTGTILTSTGDYRYLDGSYEAGLLRLSTFDGAHAFLFHARAQIDGGLVGDFWSRDSYHATWTATPIELDEPVLPDPWQQVLPTDDQRRFRFSFENLNGELVSSDDPEFLGKVVLINLFGSWCPNCNDEAPLLAEWHRRWTDEGLEVVGLAFEFSGDPVRDRRVLGRYAKRYGISYPLLLAGVSDKAEASKAVPDLSAVLSYPTTVFIGRDGKVRWIHSGFSGPGTGHHHEELVEEMERRIGVLLAER